MARRSTLSIATALVAVASVRAARADDSRRSSPLELGATFGYAFPAGSAERASQISDVAIGAIPATVDVGVRLSQRVLFVGALSYALTIPTVCASASDCRASLGHDVTLTVRGRYLLPSWRAFEPRLDLGAGYEALTTKVSDNGVTSSRSWRGVVFGTELQGCIRIARSRWSIGPEVGAWTGVFGRASLDAPGLSRSGGVDGARPHAWFDLGLRTGVEL